MICPLTLSVQHSVSGTTNEHECVKEECSWWDPEYKACCIGVIAHELKTHLGKNIF